MALSDCRSARDIVTRPALGNGPVTERDLTEARAHIAGCAACRGHLARFSRAILSGAPDELPCAEVRLRLAADNPKRSVGDGANIVRRHLARCPACAAEAAAWERVTSPAGQGALAGPPRYPVFDLSFLRQPQVVDVWTQVRAQVRRLAYEIPAALALAGQALVSPPPGLAVSYATVQAARRAARKGKENLVSLSVDDQQQDIRISLNVTEAEKALWLAVTMRLLSSGQILTGARVALCDEQGQAQEIKTVRPGEADVRFPDIRPGRYIVRVERSGKTWELPLSL